MKTSEATMPKDSADKTVNPKQIRVWDIGTRLFHWTLVILFSLSAYSAFQDKFGIYATVHLWSGFSILVLVSWRIFWGFLGSDTARFSSFLASPKTVWAYVANTIKKEPYHSVGHNPLGGWSVVLMLVLLAAQTILGLFATDDMIFSGPLSNKIGSDLAGEITALHEIVGFTLFGVVGLHILAISFVWLVQGTNLVVPMITGNKPQMGHSAPFPIVRPSWMAFLIFAVLAGGLYWFVF